MAKKRMQFAVARLNLVQAGLRGLTRGDFALREPGDEFGDGKLIEHGV